MVLPAGAVTTIYNVLAVGATGRVTIRYAKAVKRTSHDHKCRRYPVLSCTANMYDETNRSPQFGGMPDPRTDLSLKHLVASFYSVITEGAPHIIRTDCTFSSG